MAFPATFLLLETEEGAMASVIAKVRALVACVCFAAGIVPACVITVGPGTGGETSPDPMGSPSAGAGGEAGEGGGSAAGGAAVTPEEVAQYMAVVNSDPEGAAIASA